MWRFLLPGSVWGGRTKKEEKSPGARKKWGEKAEKRRKKPRNDEEAGRKSGKKKEKAPE